MTALIAQLPQLLPAAGIALALAVFLAMRPRAFAAMWIAVICFVPWWVGVEIRQFFQVSSLLSLMGLVCFTPALIRKVTIPDWGVVAFFVACLLPVVAGGSTSSGTFGVLFVWVPAYLVGRRIPARVDMEWLYGVVAVLFSMVAVLAIAESVFKWNPFVEIRFGSSSLYQTWATLQSRGGVLRTEGAFGHSIALGSSLALAIPLTLASRFRPMLRVAAVGLMLAASALTLSRSGMLCSALSLVVTLAVMRDVLSKRLRIWIATTAVTIGIVLVPLVSDTFAAAGSEATRSSDYRGALTELIPQMNWVGVSDAAQRLPDGEVYFATFRSIDNQLILTGVTYGGFALVVAILLLLAAVVAVFSRRATPPAIAVVCQLPALASVALITQYGVFFWFVVGIAVAAHASQYSSSARELATAARQGDQQLALAASLKVPPARSAI